MALFSGSGKKYSIMYFTSREEEKISIYKSVTK